MNRRTLTIVVALVLVIGLGFALWRFISPGQQSLNSAKDTHNADNFGTLDIPLNGLSQSGQLSLNSSKSLNINGQLKVNNGFVIAPSDQPTQGVAGQMYYDRGTNQLNYYNGSGFVSLTSNPQTVTSINGTSGALTLGGGLSLNGTQLRNNGIVNVTSASANLTVTNDGNGNVTLGTVGGSVQSTGGTSGSIALFNGAQTITSSIITQANGAIAINGNATVSGTLNLQSPGTQTINLTETTSGVVGQIYNDGNLHITGGTNNLWLDAGGTGTIFLNAGNSNHVAIGESTIPTYPLEVNGDINLTAGHSYRIGGTVICSISGCTGGGGGTSVSSLNGLSGALTIADATASGSTITINDASTTQKGIASFNSTNFTVTSGAVNTIQNIDPTANPTFVGINTSAITPNGTPLTVGSNTQDLTLQGTNVLLNRVSGGNTSTLSFAAPTANVTYRLQTAAAGTYDVCTTVGNCVGVGGTVSTSGGTTNHLTKFTGAQTLGDSLITDNGTTITVAGDLSVTGNVTFSNPLPVTSGGTGAVSPAGARLNLGAASSGANSDITSITGLTTALGVTQGGTGATTLTANGILLGNGTGAISSLAAASANLCLVSTVGAPTWQSCPGGGGVTSVNSLTGAITIANSTAAGSTITIDDASTSQKGLAQFNSTNFSVTSGVVNTIQDIAASSAPTFGRLTVTSSQASNGMLLVNNTNAAGTGNLIDLQLNGSSKFAVSPAGALTLSSTINGQTISSSASFTGTVGVSGAASLNGGATVIGTLTANTITPSSSLAIGATAQSFVMQGNASSTITASSGANTTTVAFQSPTASVTYRLLTAAAGTYDICTTVGNCAGVGGGVTTTGGTANTIAKFTSSGAIGDSLITDNGTTVTVGGTLSVNTITPAAALTIGATTQNLTLQGATTQLTATSGTVTNTLTFATPASTNKTITIPNATGTVAVSASGPLSIDANGNISCPSCVTSGGGSGGVGAVDSLDGLTGALTIANSTGSGSTVTINDASTSQKGLAQFNSTNFSASAGTINTIQDIATTAAPTFGQLTLSSSQATAAMLTVNNTNVAATGNLVDLQLNGTSKFAVSPAGALTLSGTVNGQTISSSANFTGTVGVTGNLTTNATLSAAAASITNNLNVSGTTTTAALSVTNDAGVGGNLNVTGTVAANTITPTSALTVGATSLSFTLQGNASSTITATGGGFTTTVGFTGTAAGAVAYNFDRAASAGTYTICTTAGNCTGVGGGVTTTGGTTNVIPKFTGAQTVGDSSISDDGTNVTIAAGLKVNTITPTSAMTLGATSQNLTLQGATVNLSATSTGITNTLTFSTPSGSNKTITLPNASGTVAVSASGALSLDANGNLTCPSCVTGSAVSSLNSQTGAVTLANAVGSGGVVTINDASTSQKGIAQFNSTNFSASAGTINTIQDINTTAAPTFARLTVTSNQGSSDMFVVNNTNVATTGSLLRLQLNGTDKFTVDSAGNVVAAGTITSGNINGQTISSAANFTGSVAIGTTLNVNTITPTGALTIGATNQNITLQGATTRLSATAASITNTLTFATPSGSNKTITLPDATGTVCLDSGNCLGGSGGANASLSNLSSVAINTSLLPGVAGGISLGSGTLPWGDIYLSGSSATPGTNNFKITGASTSGTRTITLPDASGTVCLQSSSSCGFLMSTPTLQQAYDASTSPEIVVNATNKALTIRDAASPIGDNLLEVQDNAGATNFFAVSAIAAAFNRPLSVRALGGDSTTAFNVMNAAGSNLFTVDSVNSRVGINLGSGNLPTLSGAGLEVHGSLRLSGSSDSDTYVTPLGASLATRINIPNYLQSAYAPILALGVLSTSPDTARGILVADARTVAHQPTIGVLNPNEQTVFGLSWDGNNSIASLKSTGDAIAIQGNGMNIATFERVTSTDGRVGIMNGSPNYPLDVVGDVNTSTAYRIGGTSVCDTTGSTGCIAKSGSGYYIHNQTTLQNANFNIQASDTTAPTAVIEQGATGTADIFDILKNDGTTKYLSVTSAGNLSVANGSTYSLNSSSSGSVLSSGAITITAGAASTWSVSSGALTIQGATGTASGDLVLQAGTGGIISIGSNSVNNKVINIGSTGNVVNNSTVNIANTGGNATQSVNIGSTSSANNVVLIQGGSSASAVQVQVASGGTIGIANNAVAQTVKVGNVTGATGVTLNSGTAGTTITSTGSTTVKQSGTATTTAFQVQNVAATNTALDVDALNGRVGINTSSPASMLQANQSSLAPGTVTNSASGTTVTGSGTSFLSKFQPGDTFTITSSGNTCTVKQITSDTSLVCSSALASASSGSAYSFTQQTRLSVTDGGNTNVAGTLAVSNPGVSDQYSLRVNTSTGAFNISSNSVGNSSTGITTDFGNNGIISASQYNSGTGGTLNALRVYFPNVDASPNNHVKVAIYNDASGAPGTIVSSVSAPSTVVTAGTWTTVSLGQTVTLTPNTNYWFAFNVDGGTTTYGYSNGATSKYVSMTYSGNFPSSFGTPSSSGAAAYSIYGAYTTVTDTSAINSAISIDGNNNVTVKPTWDSKNAFGVVSTGGTQVLEADTINNYVGTNNLVVNGSFDSNYRLTVGGAANITGNLNAGTFSGAGLTTDCSSSNSKLLWSSSTKKFSCGTDRASATIRKTADESVTSSTTIQNDDQFSFAVGANETWAYQIYANVTSATAELRSGISAPTGSTCNYAANNMYNATNYATNLCGDPGNTANSGSTNTQEYVIYGTVVTGSTAGTVNWQWTQGTSSTNATTVQAGSYMIAYKISGADVAEAYYTHDGSIMPGDIVSLDPTSAAGVNKSKSAYDTTALGVISTNPGQILADPKAGSATGRPVLVALNGRIPVKVTSANGIIHAGDFLTTSSTPGVAMKATRPGQVIGRALADYNSPGVGSVLMFAGQQWADPRTSDGSESEADTLQNANLTNLTADNATVGTLTVTKNAEFKGDMVVHGNTSVVDLMVNGHIITGGGKPTISNQTCSGANVAIDGTDTAGLITVTTPANCNGTGDIAAANFNKAFGKAPRVTITPANADAASLKTYVDSDAITPTSFTIATPTNIDGSKTYRWYYQVLQ